MKTPIPRSCTTAIALASLLTVPTLAATAAVASAHPPTDLATRVNATSAVATAAVADREVSPSHESDESTETSDQRADRSGLVAIENATEAIAEGETSGGAAARAARRVVSQWPGVRATLAQQGATTATLVAVDGTIVALRDDASTPGKLPRAANEVTGAIAPLFTYVGERIPAGVHVLDYLGRSVTLDVRASDWTRARRDAAVVQRQWSAGRPQVAARTGGAAAAVRFDHATGAIATATSSENARASLDAATLTTGAVDAVEKVF
ncbi:MAG: hypothetical protein NVS1B2_16400 [Vulcanimicrobiaceae bacterium]